MSDIVLIEDSALVIQMLTMVCEGAGHQVAAFESFQKAQAQLQQSTPDLIITDLNLPDVPGGDTLSQLRAIEGLNDTPIIVISGRPADELEKLASESGAQGALSKDDGMPVISEKLPQMIKELIADH